MKHFDFDAILWKMFDYALGIAVICTAICAVIGTIFIVKITLKHPKQPQLSPQEQQSPRPKPQGAGSAYYFVSPRTR